MVTTFRFAEQVVPIYREILPMKAGKPTCGRQARQEIIPLCENRRSFNPDHREAELKYSHGAYLWENRYLMQIKSIIPLECHPKKNQRNLWILLSHLREGSIIDQLNSHFFNGPFHPSMRQ
jgi:hypothetical protein